MCQLLVEAMEAGGCGWSAQIPGDIGNVQRDYDGTPMVTDEMTEREIIAFSRALREHRARHDADHRAARDRGADRPRERPADHLERAAAPTGAVNQHGGVASTRTATRSKRLDELNEEEGVRVLRSAQIVRFTRRSCSRTTTSWTSFPAWREACLGTDRGEDRQVRRPGAPAGHEGSDPTMHAAAASGRRGIRSPRSR